MLVHSQYANGSINIEMSETGAWVAFRKQISALLVPERRSLSSAQSLARGRSPQPELLPPRRGGKGPGPKLKGLLAWVGVVLDPCPPLATRRVAPKIRRLLLRKPTKKLFRPLLKII